jgi:amino acid permease
VEATCIVSGFGIGGGVMAVPFLAAKSGLGPMLLVVVAALLVSLLLHLIVAEIMLRAGQARQLVEVFQKYLVGPRRSPYLAWPLFGAMSLSFLGLVAAYVAGGGAILGELFQLPPLAGALCFYGIAAGVVFFGLKALGVSEKYGLLAMVLLLAALASGLDGPRNLRLQAVGTYQDHLALFGMVMFCFMAIFSVPQVVEGLAWRRSLIPWAIVAGLGVNALVTVTVSLLTLAATGATGDIHEVAIISLGQALGGWARLVASVFVLVAMLTSYWSVSFALVVVIQGQTNWGPRQCWLLATLPSLLVVLLVSDSFLSLLQLAGGSVALLVAVMLVPLYRNVKRQGTASPQWGLGLLGSPLFQGLVLLGVAAMAVGTLQPW